MSTSPSPAASTDLDATAAADPADEGAPEAASPESASPETASPETASVDTTPAKPASRNNHWKRRPRTAAIPADQAARQGEITRLAFLQLGRERAIGFLNSDHEALGGRPLALATESSEGQALVEAELERLSASET